MGERRVKSGLVYALSEGELPDPVPVDQDFFIKIGFTTGKSADSRSKQCQTGNPRQLEIVDQLAGSSFHEMRIHKLLKRYQRVGEWFLLPGALVSQLKSHSFDSAHDLVEHLEALGLRNDHTNGSIESEADKHMAAMEVFQCAQDQHDLADRLVSHMEELGDIGEVDGWFVLDAMCGAGIKLADGSGQTNSAFVMQIFKEAL
jgi:hypothetical protein